MLLAGALGWLYSVKAEWTPPTLSVTPEQLAVSAKTVFTIKATDEDSNLRTVRVIAQQGDKTFQILDLKVTEEAKELTEQFTIPKEGLGNGPLTLMVSVTDTSWHRFGRGNISQITRELHIDTRAPMISVLSGQHNVNQGGSGVVVYSTNEELRQSGVRMGDHFFPGYPYQAGKYLCFFAIPHNMDAKDAAPVLVARDMADNECTVGFMFRARPKTFRHDNINISERFLHAKMPQFANMYPDLSQPLDIFLRVNSELRKKNVAFLKELGKDTVPQMLWSGPFVRLPNSAPMAGFGDNRTYMHQDKPVDNQTHMGVDLASLATAPVPAGNTGRVILAEFMGIYGNVIVIDHGFGVHSLYSHLSEMHIHKGDHVERGQIIGKTGATGMAGGDHLHFGMLISGLEVQPIEWWDQHWITDNITSKLQ